VVALGTFAHSDSAGTNRLRFTGRVHSKRLKPGRYQLRAAALNTSGQISAPSTVGFRVLR
jgi:predicted phage tail protein